MTPPRPQAALPRGFPGRSTPAPARARVLRRIKVWERSADNDFDWCEKAEVLNTSRYLLIAAMTGLASVVCLLLVFRAVALSSLVDHETRSNVALTAVFSNSVWPRYRDTIAEDPARDARAPPSSAGLDVEVRRLMRGSAVMKVKIYDLSGITVYSSDPSQIGEDKSTNSGFLAARAGRAASDVTFREEFDAFEGRRNDLDLVSSYIPIRSPGSGEVDAVFEVYSDVTALMRQMQRMQWQIVAATLGGVSMIYLLLLFTARRADRIEVQWRNDILRREQESRHQAYHDSVTGLPNRAYFQRALEAAVDRADRDGRLLGVIFLDMDRFKLVNDSFGHDAGDELLRLVAARLGRCVRGGDTLFRMGGDEFTILAEGISRPQELASLARRILAAMQRPFRIESRSIAASMSIGISVFPCDDDVPSQLVKNADAAMYLAKESGRNRFRFYTAEMDRDAGDRLAMELALQQALGREEFVLHYAPRMSARKATVVGFEALLGWRRDGTGLLPRATFLSALEQGGLMASVAEWVLAQACAQCRIWNEARDEPVRVSVEVSPRQLVQRDFVRQVENALAGSGLDARHLELAVPESGVLEDPARSLRVLERLAALGVVLTLDEFGAGYSSFDALKRLPIDFIKIDRSLVSDLRKGSRELAVVTAIAGVAQGLGIGLVAPGVDRPAQGTLLAAVGCHEVQGALYGNPVPACAVGDWLDQPPSPRVAAG
jgi:diguanylate cyclase (GGDEF)-like protein